MKCRDLASRPVVTVTPNTTLEEAIEIMAQHDIGALVVVSGEGSKRPVGILTERDVVRTIAGKAPLTVTVDKAATTHPLVYVYVDDPVEAAVEMMNKHWIRHVLVLERNGELYGIISMRDVVRALGKIIALEVQ